MSKPIPPPPFPTASGAFASKLAALLAAPALIAGLALAQTAPQPSAAATNPTPPPANTPVVTDQAASSPSANDQNQTIELNPFEVTASQNTGYLASSALSGTRLRSSLNDIPAAVDVVTKDFMQDINANDLNNLLIYTLGTEVSGPGGNYSGAVVDSTFLDFETQLQYANPQTRVRGLVSADVAEDFFITDTPLDNYNISQVEISRGANAMLFGLGSPGGIINSDLNEAEVGRTAGTVQQNFGEYGSLRNAIDYNQVLVPNKLALRIDTLHDKEYYRIQPTYSEDNRVYLAGTYKPFKNTTIQVNAEIGRDNANKPEDRTPFDGYSMWWAEGKPVWNSATERFSFLGTPSGPFTTSTVYSNPTKFSPNNFETTSIGLGGSGEQMDLYYSNPNSSQPGIPGQDFVGIEGEPGASGMKGLAGWDRVDNSLIHVKDETRGFWRIPMMTNPNVFDFYHYQLGGPNSYQWAQWETYNAYFNQTFLNNHVGFRLAWDHQEMDEGEMSDTTFDNDQIKVDINQVLPNGAPNPNLGRLLVGSTGFDYLNGIQADNLQATVFGEINAHDYLPNWLGEALGDHTFTGAYTRQDTTTDISEGTPFDAAEDYIQAIWGPGDVEDVAEGVRAVGMLHYIGPSVADVANPAEAHAQSYTGQWPANIRTVSILADPSVTSGVGTPDSTPAGWTAANYSIQGSGAYDLTYTSRAGYDSLTREEVNSGIIIGQNKWFDGNLVTTEGIRRDTVFSYDAGSNPDNAATGVAVPEGPLWYPKLTSI
ncbi:MAG: TonB-dependent receptor plug domain-containing protein, partial [Opitutaceae bacterium]